MSAPGKRFTTLDPDGMDALIGSPAQRYDEITELWDTLLLKEGELARAEVILSAMKALSSSPCSPTQPQRPPRPPTA